jgi:hypothetical protein
MSTTMDRRTDSDVVATPSILPLALAEARRFGRHPLFLLAVLLEVTIVGVLVVQEDVVTVSPLEDTVFPTFLFGVFGFVVAHRLTTGLKPARELPETVPTTEQRRTVALCLACLVPFTAGVLLTLVWLVAGALWPPQPQAPAETVAWFADMPTWPLVAAIVASLPLPTLGGPLLGVAVARWAPFRGSALLGTVLLVVGSAYGDALPGSWFAVSPWANMSSSLVVDGTILGSWLREDVVMGWRALYIACLCALAALAALLRDRSDRGRLLVVSGAVSGLAVVSLALAMS